MARLLRLVSVSGWSGPSAASRTARALVCRLTASVVQAQARKSGPGRPAASPGSPATRRTPCRADCWPGPGRRPPSPPGRPATGPGCGTPRPGRCSPPRPASATPPTAPAPLGRSARLRLPGRLLGRVSRPVGRCWSRTLARACTAATAPRPITPATSATAAAATAVRCRRAHRRARIETGSRQAVTGSSASHLVTSSARARAEA